MQVIRKNSNPFKIYKEKKDGKYKGVKEITYDNPDVILKNNDAKYNILSDYYNKNNVLDSNRLKYSKNGTMYRMNNYNLTLFQIYLLNIFIGAIFYLLISIFCYIFVSKTIIVDLIIGIIGFIVAPIYRSIQNSKDNNIIKKDICNIYILLNTDLNKDILIYDSLKHISENIKNLRLKYAFDELISNINNNKTTIDESLLLFNNRFTSDDINNLSLCILKIIKTGINEDIKKEIKKNIEKIITEITKEINNKEKDNISTITNCFTILSIIIVIYFVYKNI